MRNLRVLLATTTAFVLIVAGCEWAIGQEGATGIAWVRDEPVVFEMTVDPSDTTVPPEVSQWLDGNYFAWDGEPFSWQCYSFRNSAFGSIPDVEPVYSGPKRVHDLALPITADIGDFLEIEVNWTATGPIGIQYESFCEYEPTFVPINGSSTSRPRLCDLGVLVNGEVADRVTGGLEIKTLHGPLTDADPVVEFVTLACAGRQYDTADITMKVEVLATADSGSLPFTGTTYTVPGTVP